MNPRVTGLISVAFILAQSLDVVVADSIRVLSSGIESANHESTPVVPAVFGNRNEKITVSIDGTAPAPAYLRADMLQVADRLAMPLAKDMHLIEGIAFPNGARQDLQAAIKIPDVKRMTEILVQLALVPNGQPATSIHLADIHLDVFPASLTKELTDLLHAQPDGSAQVVVFGAGQKLRHFLTGLHVVFEDGGDGTPDRFDAKRFYFGEMTTSEERQTTVDRSAGARVALFSNDESLPPGIYANQSNAGVLINVNLPILDNLNDDPRAQLALIKIIHQLSTAPVSAN